MYEPPHLAPGRGSWFPGRVRNRRVRLQELREPSFDHSMYWRKCLTQPE